MDLPQRISVVLPVYNESDNIAPCLRGLWGALQGVEHEILVCYDFDEDTTLPAIAQMKDAPPTVRLVKNDIGRGAANALKAGFAAATGDVVVTTMADLSDPPEAIPAMADKVRREGAAVVSGSRYMFGGSQTGGPLVKRTLSRIACLLLRWIAGVGTHDATTNFKAYAKSFLARTTIESTTAFDIALELTVKAHLAGERVDEVPSTWVDRTHGASRFRVWAWAPRYLRWWGRAMVEPACVWLPWLALTLWSLSLPGWTGGHTGADRAVTLGLAAVGCAMILLARSSRGRMRVVDVAHAVLWCHPLHAWLLDDFLAVVDFAVTPSVSVAVLVATVPGERLRARLRALVSARTLAALAFGLALWLARFTPPKLSASFGLDDSWREALSYFHARGFRAGVDYVFTYGPLGFLDVGQFRSEQFWTRILVWESAVELACAAVFAMRFARLASWLQRVLFALLACCAASNSDAYLPLVVVLATVELLDTRLRSFAALTAGMAVLAIVALVKVSYFVLVGACVALQIAPLLARKRVGTAATVAATFLAALLATWWCCGQRVGDALTFLSTSLAMASGYTDGMSLPAPASALAIGAITLALVLARIALEMFAGAPTLERRAGSVALALGSLMAFKSSYVRFDRDGTLALFASVAVLAVPDAGLPRGRAWRVGAWSLRVACVTLALFGTRAGIDGGWRGVLTLPVDVATSCASAAKALFHLDAEKSEQERRAAVFDEQFALPRVRAVVGSEPCDLFGVNQAVMFRAGLDYRPRPVFQPYAAYTRELAELNARFLASATAPRFVLARLESVDGHLATLDDGPALQRLLRDYRPELSERGFVLWSRKPDGELAAASARSVVLEREARLDEWVELSLPSDGCYVATMEIEPSTLGRVRRAVYQSDALVLQVRAERGEVQASRAPASMLATGFVLDPLLRDQFALVRWFSGLRTSRAQAVRLIEYAGAEGSFESTYRLRIERADELRVAVPQDAERRFVYAMFDSKPDSVLTTNAPTTALMFNREALIVYAPSEMRFAVAAGEHVVQGLFLLGPNAYDGGNSDGVTFSVELAGAARPLFERHLDPVRVAAEREMQSFRVEFTAPQATHLSLRTNPGPRNDATDDWACWSGVRIQPRAQ